MDQNFLKNFDSYRQVYVKLCRTELIPVDPREISSRVDKIRENELEIGQKKKGIVDAEENLLKHPKLRMKLEKEVNLMTEKKISKFNKKKKLVWDNLVSIKSNKERISQLKKENRKLGKEMKLLNVQKVNFKRLEIQVWDLLEAIFRNYHNLFPMEKQIYNQYLLFLGGLQKDKKALDYFSSILRELEESKKLFTTAYVDLQELYKDVQGLITAFSTNQSKGLLLSSFISTDSYDFDLLLSSKNVKKLNNCKILLHKSYQRLFNARLYLPNDPIFENISKQKYTETSKNFNLKFGDAKSLLDILQRDGVRDRRKSMLDMDRTKEAIGILRLQDEELNRVILYFSRKVENLQKNYDHVKNQLLMLRTKLIQERKKILDNVGRNNSNSFGFGYGFSNQQVNFQGNAPMPNSPIQFSNLTQNNTRDIPIPSVPTVSMNNFLLKKGKDSQNNDDPPIVYHI